MKIKGNQTPAIAVVVYGNRAYEDALLELKDTLEQTVLLLRPPALLLPGILFFPLRRPAGRIGTI